MITVSCISSVSVSVDCELILHYIHVWRDRIYHICILDNLDIYIYIYIIDGSIFDNLYVFLQICMFDVIW